ncbi:hypothetical protein [Blastococcus brunescens]|uniref:Glycosyltransferase RgtA/B/C/D-like domain-containing protein n=1 Tax=Blastococcus brunescens TaxID=1564165 RepID=A0ABZ1AT34_9ACTN|nr:hypothetical protein [Blastococcus sp. BMG 8361]WRL61732.1 hypothetical protein U6N30_16480 [Blastococcus sp. BMG 8361]
MTVDEGWTRPEPSPWPARLLALVVALLVTGPALAPGFVLLRDMVFVPRQDLDLDALGLGGGLPRAVPVDAVMAVVTTVVPGEFVQKAVLLATVYAAVLGAARLVPPGPDGRRGIAAVVAGLVYGWSPYLAERLLIGHWTLLLAFAALPWIARAALRFRDGEPRALPRLVLACAPAALTPTGALLAAGVVLALVGRRHLLPAATVLLVLSLPWVVAGVLHPAGGASDPAGVAAFAARPEGWGGALLALLGTGGIWNAGAVPAGRGSVLLPLVTLALVALAVVGWAGGGARRGPGLRLLVLGALGLVLALAGTVPGLREGLEVVVRSVPGGGLLRDGQKWVAWWALPLALGAGLGARRLADAVRARDVLPGAAGLVAAAAVLLPVIAVPDLVWGVGGRLQAVDYPADWERVRDVLADDEHPGDVLVLPFGAYRAFGWNDDRPQLDPAPRWLPRPTITDDALVVDGRVVEGRTSVPARWRPSATTRRRSPSSGWAGCSWNGARPAATSPTR